MKSANGLKSLFLEALNGSTEKGMLNPFLKCAIHKQGAFFELLRIL